ncbi:hypothetical protein DPMN_066283 [Dreissena polymorpha]|uniref:Uncharacterized protein n=1 Tax=Dreissena polymorpha TaxID=45954 RepID=A0A9D4BSS9_DREPO|nr:hypothetical protein DPMN_066283 [Dreissena polymorpha]
MASKLAIDTNRMTEIVGVVLLLSTDFLCIVMNITVFSLTRAANSIAVESVPSAAALRGFTPYRTVTIDDF